MLSFNFKGCRISFSVGFFALITLMLITCRMTLSVQSLFCAFFHEFGHITAMLIFGESLCSIEFSAFGIKIEKSVVSVLNYGQEVIVSLSGIFANIILALLAFLFSAVFSVDTASQFGAVSLAVGVFNLLPIDTLDGAAALKFALAARKNERYAQSVVFWLSLSCTILLLIFTVTASVMQKVNFSLIAVTVYLSMTLLRHFVGRG